MVLGIDGVAISWAEKEKELSALLSRPQNGSLTSASGIGLAIVKPKRAKAKTPRNFMMSFEIVYGWKGNQVLWYV